MNNTFNEQEQTQTATPKVDEASGVLVEGFIKIFDPTTGESYVEERA